MRQLDSGSTAASNPPRQQPQCPALTRKHVVEITINGEPKTIPDGLTVAGLLEMLGKQPRYLAVERNKELVPRTHHAECPLRSGDQIEIVTLVGGG